MNDRGSRSPSTGVSSARRAVTARRGKQGPAGGALCRVHRTASLSGTSSAVWITWSGGRYELSPASLLAGWNRGAVPGDGGGGAPARRTAGGTDLSRRRIH